MWPETALVTAGLLPVCYFLGRVISLSIAVLLVIRHKNVEMGTEKAKWKLALEFSLLWIFSICDCLLLLQCNRMLLSLLLLLLSDISTDRKEPNKILPPMEATCSLSKAKRIAFVPSVTSSQQGAIKHDLKVVMSIRE